MASERPSEQPEGFRFSTQPSAGVDLLEPTLDDVTSPDVHFQGNELPDDWEPFS